MKSFTHTEKYAFLVFYNDKHGDKTSLIQLLKFEPAYNKIDELFDSHDLALREEYGADLESNGSVISVLPTHVESVIKKDTSVYSKTMLALDYLRNREAIQYSNPPYWNRTIKDINRENQQLFKPV